MIPSEHDLSPAQPAHVLYPHSAYDTLYHQSGGGNGSIPKMLVS